MLKHVGIEPADNIVQLFLQLPYDRQQEHEADLIAMVLLSKVRSVRARFISNIAQVSGCKAHDAANDAELQIAAEGSVTAAHVRTHACAVVNHSLYIPRSMVLTVPGGLQACYNFAAGIELFARLQKEAKDCDTDAWLQHWSSHPSMQDRVAKLKAHFPTILKDSPCVYKQELLEAMAHIASVSV